MLFGGQNGRLQCFGVTAIKYWSLRENSFRLETSNNCRTANNWHSGSKGNLQEVNSDRLSDGVIHTLRLPCSLTNQVIALPLLTKNAFSTVWADQKLLMTSRRLRAKLYHYCTVWLTHKDELTSAEKPWGMDPQRTYTASLSASHFA